MNSKRRLLSIFFKCFAGALLLYIAAGYAQDAKPDPTGTWIWSTPGRNGGASRTNTLTLKIEDSKLTGKLSVPGRGGQINETPISDGTVDNENVSFSVVREFNGNSVTNKYTGKIAADKIVGKVEFTRDGEPQSRDWQASRSTAGQ